MKIDATVDPPPQTLAAPQEGSRPTSVWDLLLHGLGLDSLRGMLRFYALLLVCLPLALAVLFFSLFGRDRLVRAELKGLVDTLGYERGVVRTWMDERLGDAAFLAGLDAARQGDVQALDAIFASYVQSHRYVTAVVLVSATGYTVFDSSRRAPGIYVGDRDYFLAARQGRGTISGVLASRADGQPLCIVSTPVMREGRFLGIIFMPVEMLSLDALLGEAGAGRRGEVLLTDATGRVLAPAMTESVAGQGGTLPPALLATGPDGGRYRDADGREMLGAAMDIGVQDWRLVRRVPVAQALSAYRRQTIWVVGGAVVTILLLTPLLLRLCGNLERPLEALAGYARQLRSSDYGPACGPLPPGSMPLEMRELYEAFCAMADDVRQHIKETERLSIQDHLTGLYNRRFLYAGGAKLLDAAERGNRQCACLMIDVDLFKAVNDTYGHQTGDLVLAHVAAVINQSVRKSDIVARYGGEEFAVLLTGADLYQGAQLGERIRQTLATTPCPVDGGSLLVTVSIGVAQARREVRYGGSALDDLLARSDTAMYAAKAAGRDRVVLEDGPDQVSG